MAIYIWKIINGITPNIEGDNGDDVMVAEGGRRGRYVILPNIDLRSRVAVQTMISQSLPFNGKRIFNSLPKYLRGYRGSAETFNIKLDEYLKGIPDRPYLQHYPLSTLSNSLAVFSL